MAGVSGSGHPAPGELCRGYEVSRWRRPGRGGAGPPGAGAAGRRGDDRGRGQRPGGREAVPGLADEREPVAAGPGGRRPGGAGLQGRGRGEVHAGGDGRAAAPPRVVRAGPGTAGRGAGRGEDRQVAGGHLAGHKSTAADLGAWLCWEDESGQGLRPPRGRTWGRRGRTPVETVWSNLKRSLANLVKHDINQLTALVKTRLRQMQYRPGLLAGFLAKPR